MSPGTFFFFFSLGLPPWHTEVPRLGVESELQLPAYTTATAMRDPNRIWDSHHSSRQRRILNALTEARDRTHNLIVPSWVHFHRTTTGTLLQGHLTMSGDMFGCHNWWREGLLLASNASRLGRLLNILQGAGRLHDKDDLAPNVMVHRGGGRGCEEPCLQCRTTSFSFAVPVTLGVSRPVIHNYIHPQQYLLPESTRSF